MIAAVVKATSVRLPMQLFFKLSGLFLFMLAIVFAGNGVFELQNAGVLITTNLGWMGRGLPWAGLFPNLQVLSVQGLLLFGALAAWLIVPRAALGVGAGNPPGYQACGEARVTQSVGEAHGVAALDRSERGRRDPRERGGRTCAQPELEKCSGARKSSDDEPQPAGNNVATNRRPPAGFREYPIGDDAEKNQIRIAAVYLPPVEMAGMTGPGSPSLIHVEADIHATEGNRNGFAKDEFVPYLIVHYSIVSLDAAGKSGSAEPIRGTMMPMVARDGMHYGASIEMPTAGHFKLTYAIGACPSVGGGLGRHAGPCHWRRSMVENRSRSRLTGIIPPALLGAQD